MLLWSLEKASNEKFLQELNVKKRFSSLKQLGGN